MAKSTWKSEFRPYAVLSTRAQQCATLIENLALSSLKKDERKDLQNYLNQKTIGTINTVDDAFSARSSRSC